MKKFLKSALLTALIATTIGMMSCVEEEDPSVDAPVASFTVAVDGADVTFSNTSTGEGNTYLWDFGDGTSSTSSEMTVTKTYTEADTYTVTLVATNEGGTSSPATEEVVITASAVDTEAPVITLEGDATINLTVGDTFDDPGATAIDNVDGDISDAIMVTGSVDVNTAATYTLSYNVSDAAGNAAMEVTRDVIVAEAAACTPETEETLAADGFNWTMLTDPSADVIDDGVTFSWIDNPDSENAINSSCKVGQATKKGANPWDNLQYDLANKIDFEANGGFKIKVWSGKADTKVRIKLEEIGNAGNNAELEKTMTKTSEWEELTFDFAASQTNKFNKIVIFFDLNANNTDTYYFDDLMLYTRTGGGGGGGGGGNAAGLVNGDFENGDEGWILFQNGGTAAFDNTINNGGSNSGKLSITGPGNPAFKQERFGAGVVEAGDVVTVSFDHIGSIAGEGGFLNVLLFVEIPDGEQGNPITHVFDPKPALGDSWTTFTGTFTIPAGSNVGGGLSLLIETVCGGATGCEVTANIDNVTVTF